MPVPRWIGWTVGAVATIAVLHWALTAYTFPSYGTGSRAIRMVITEALGDSARPRPAPAAFGSLSVTADPRASVTAPIASWARPSTFAPVIAQAARDWARAAAETDSAALRSWLVRVPTFTSRAIHQDSLYVTIRRFTLREGCPLVSTLSAAFVRTPHGGYDLLRLAADCPPVPQGEPAIR